MTANRTPVQESDTASCLIDLRGQFQDALEKGTKVHYCAAVVTSPTVVPSHVRASLQKVKRGRIAYEFRPLSIQGGWYFGFLYGSAETRRIVEDLVMEAKKANREPPRLIYVCLDKTPPPDAAQKNRIAVLASGKKFPAVCQEIHDQILKSPRRSDGADLSTWEDYTFE